MESRFQSGALCLRKEYVDNKNDSTLGTKQDRSLLQSPKSMTLINEDFQNFFSGHSDRVWIGL